MNRNLAATTLQAADNIAWYSCQLARLWKCSEHLALAYLRVQAITTVRDVAGAYHLARFLRVPHADLEAMPARLAVLLSQDRGHRQ